ncbi:MAG: hypothetical protein A3A86_00785 [Elusimicrobia bacterium RIFCSPLOWO2_01_FULL_60_11]|nr:MAG: hypothetical protein A3A86_00785 [Elusimicrobia bacterium RIFCSPLOWO2_01_FULL_60_11]
MDNEELLKISAVAEQAQVAGSTIRHYTDMGLIRVAGYTDGGQRLYSKTETLERLARIQAFSRRGLTLPEIKMAMEGKSRSKKILIVDDEQEVSELLVELLKSKFPDYQVRVAGDGFTAGRLIGEFFPDLIVLDLMLPGVDGFHVCRQIRQDPLLSGILVLAITGFDSSEMKKKIMDCGANDYLAKPMENSEFIARIKKLLNPS